MSSETAATAPLNRDELALEYLDQLPFTPYPVQEQAIFAWFSCEQGVLVCAPTGTGKTLIAEAAAFEALKNGTTMYYTTPLIALTDQKFLEMQDAAERWGYSRDDVGLVTGNRQVNPQAKVLVVVAEILLNRLLQPSSFDFENVSAVVMDEFHSFSDPERGIVWEFSLSLLPAHVRVLLLSATVGNAVQFLSWLAHGHKRRLELVQSTDRKVPLAYYWVGDKLLNEHLEEMAAGNAEHRRTPALVFCFNRDECWTVAEELTGKAMLSEGQQDQLIVKISEHDWSKGAGPKLKRILMRGVGVHHAGLLPCYRRIVESLFQQKLLSVCVCTETLSSGINLPARSVVLSCLLKGPPGKQKVIDASSAHQIFGRAGRPQYDSQGYVYVLPHEDDVKILRWKEKYDQIPEDCRDPNLIKAKKAMKKKMPTRSPTRQYWNESQFDKLRVAPPRDLVSQGSLPWRMLAYMLQISPDVERLRQLVRKRLMEPKRLDQAERELHHMLRILHTAGVVRLEPEPPPMAAPLAATTSSAPATNAAPGAATPPPAQKRSAMEQLILEALQSNFDATGKGARPVDLIPPSEQAAPEYRPMFAHSTERMKDFFVFRSVNPLYALFLTDHFSLADPNERLQAWESVLELPRSLIRSVRVPKPDIMPPGPLALEKVDIELVAKGLIPAGDLYPEFDPDLPPEERKYAPSLGEKLRMLFDAEYPNVHGVFVQPVWAAGELLEYDCDFHKYISGHQLAKQEGLLFRHLLRLSLLLGEFSQVVPPGLDPVAWRDELRELADRFTDCCHQVDPKSTEHTLAQAAVPDAVEAQVPLDIKRYVPTFHKDGGEAKIQPPSLEEEAAEVEELPQFGAGILDSD